MSKRPFVIFGILAVCLAVLIPLWAYLADADEENLTGKLTASERDGKDLFVTNCGTCHALSAAGTDGNFGPDLDKLLAATGPASTKADRDRIRTQTLNAVNEGVDSDTPGRMPAEILAGEQANLVAEFVAQEAGN